MTGKEVVAVSRRRSRLGIVGEIDRFQGSRHRRHLVMRAAGLGAGAIALVLLGLGWRAKALSIAAALLLVSCAAVCAWAWSPQQRSAKRLNPGGRAVRLAVATSPDLPKRVPDHDARSRG